MNKIYLKLIGASVAITMVISLFSAIGIAFEFSDNGVIMCQIAAFLICGVVIFLYMKKKDHTLKQFGFNRIRPSRKLIGFMGVVILIQPIILGVNFNYSFSTLMLILVQMMLVGFVEETFFRGVFFYSLKTKLRKNRIFFSSIVFGLLHIASSLNPETAFILVILQIINALLLGYVFSVIYDKNHSIYIVIVFHGLFNVFATISNGSTVEKNITAVLLLSILYILFLIYSRVTTIDSKKKISV
ncbi:hypothetical protein RV11_GL000651 [Enterococcus phoeniculicola]|jgi:membrane protease YdiL (CAAX protease family)|uniref:CAAX prenyl protease 2/Lysostaphin resistance protein A-like domain-containing protein n=1 Tax=Enterococcus phoeniculicola ATCC BAA-412 TaxID=1158610 RepID=R3W6C6_9ENTE|nr:CPBP family intramembrane glutamic endopeptidase [Enterococcus phoeniculicola]EOL43132.1 hypothetical protein UC3_02109 [Enterococcus phoeniculicola ATCC BAA-412]EOT76510.1 hypothetical protein I589_01467 [Enterococcus phoeniculicola ATCC BAA-412]OJG71126.1 hypothetical protein RV11_GL000651 [Enterococcus phoeniculicola]